MCVSWGGGHQHRRPWLVVKEPGQEDAGGAGSGVRDRVSVLFRGVKARFAHSGFVDGVEFLLLLLLVPTLPERGDRWSSSGQGRRALRQPWKQHSQTLGFLGTEAELCPPKDVVKP